MLWLVTGGLALVLLLAAAQALTAMRPARLRAGLSWLGIGLAALLGLGIFVLTRGEIVIAILPFAVPLALRFFTGPAARGSRSGAGASKVPPRGSGMTRTEAYAVLGLAPGASEQEIRAAYARLIRAAHPDHGGSDWLAARLNEARDVLLGR